MKIRVSTAKTIVVLLIASICRYFAIFRTSKVIYSGDLVSLSVIFITAIAIVLTNGKILTSKYIGEYSFWISLTLVMWVTQLIHSTIAYHKYGQTFFQVLSVGYLTLSVLMLYVLAYYQEHIEPIDYLKNIIVSAALAVSIISVAQVYLYKFGIIFLDVGTVTTNDIRNGTLRFRLGQGIVPFALYITLLEAIYEPRNRIKNLIFSLIYISCLSYAVKTRSLNLCIIITLYLILLFYLKKRTTKVLLIMIGATSLALLIKTGTLYDYFTGLSKDVGVNMRFNTIRFFWNEFLEHPILGMGYIKASTASPRLLTLLMGPLYYGKYRYYYRSDVGIVGMLNENGIVGALWYAMALFILFKQSIYLYKKKARKYTWCIAATLHITLCSINLIFTNSIPLFVLIMALINHYYFVEKCPKYQK